MRTTMFAHGMQAAIWHGKHDPMITRDVMRKNCCVYEGLQRISQDTPS